MEKLIHPRNNHAQRGGMTILLALVLVGVMGAATFSMSRNAIRELSMSGTIIQGEKAAAAADAGLDWVIIWGQGSYNPIEFNAATPAGGQVSLYDGLKSTLRSTTGYPPVLIPAGSDSTMTLDNKGAATASQTFDIELRLLGTLPTGKDGSSDNTEASGGTKAGGGAVGNSYWLIRSTGRSKISVGSSMVFQAQREMTASLPPVQ